MTNSELGLAMVKWQLFRCAQVLLAAGMFSGLLTGCGSRNTGTETSGSSDDPVVRKAAEVKAAQDKQKETLEKFDTIQEGAAEKDVVEKMGSPTGSTNLDSRSLSRTMPYVELPDLPTPPASVSLKTWKAGETTLEVVFVDGRVTATFTKTKPTSMAGMEEYRLWAFEQTQDKVEAMLGKPTIQTVAKPKDAKDRCIWESPDGYLIVRFADDGKARGTEWKPRKK
jgi:hypothetical protein